MMIPTFVSRAAKLTATSFLLLAAVTAARSQTTTNLLDTFNRNGALDLSSPDISDVNAPGTWTVPNGSAGFNTTNLNGGALLLSGGGYSWLPFAPQDGYVYTISLTSTIATGAGDRWVAVGFDNGLQTQPVNGG